MRTAAEIAIRAVKAYTREQCAVFAGGITYFALLSLFPLTLFAVSVTAFIFHDPGDKDRLVDRMLDTLPIDQSSGRDDLANLIDSVVAARGPLGVIGLLGAAYTGSALFGAVRASLNAVMKVERRRPFVLGKALDLLLVLIFTTFLLLSVGVTFGIALAQRFSDELFGAEAARLTSWLLTLAYAIVPTAVSAAVFFLLFTFVPARRLPARHTLAGALVAAALFEALSVLFAQFVANFGNYNATYGALGFVVILLVFINFSAQIMLLGAQVARAGVDMRLDGPARYRETAALAGTARRLAAKLPLIGARFSSPPAAGDAGEPGHAAGLLLAPERGDARQPGPGAERGLAPGPARRGTGVAPRLRRPGSWAGIALVTAAIVGVVASLRRR
jgi:membrane protein